MTAQREDFDSWKEIAAYLKRSVRTCRNFERQMGLPVHRLDGSPKARVFAYRDEIDAWLAKKSGEREKKSRPLLLVALGALFVLLAAALLLWFLVIIPGRTEVLDTIAILPFVNSSGDPAQEHLAFGLTETLISELYKVKSLRVMPRQAVLPYKGSDKPPLQIARELNAKALVEGSFLRDGDRIRLTARLIDPFRNRIVWAETLEKRADEYHVLERECARKLVEAVKVEFTPAEQARMAGGRKVDPDAYSLLMKGIAAALRPDEWLAVPPDYLEYFQKALDIDPGLALAHAWLGFEYFGFGINRIEDHRIVYPKAWEALSKALEIDENLAMAYSARGYLRYMMNWDLDGAEQDFRKALELAPGDMVIPIVYETFLCVSGRADKAIASINSRVSGLDPVGLEHRYRERRSYYYLCAKRYDEALKTLDGAPMVGLELQWHVMWAKALKGSHAEAFEIAERLKIESGSKDHSFLRRHYPMILAVTGRREQALRALEEYKASSARKNMDMTFDEACVRAGLGDRDEAFELLYRLYEERSSDILLLVSDWALHSLHGDPRFQELARKVGFPEVPGSK